MDGYARNLVGVCIRDDAGGVRIGMSEIAARRPSATSPNADATPSQRTVRTPRGWRLEQTQILPRALSEVFPFFERPENLEAITPAFLRFHVRTPSPVPMHAGARIEYRLSLFGIPFTWRTVIDVHEPGVRFVDRQESGPFAVWIHTHEFRAHPRGTCMTDVVEYRAPLGPLGRAAEFLFVRRLVARIFAHRAGVMARRFGG